MLVPRRVICFVPKQMRRYLFKIMFDMKRIISNKYKQILKKEIKYASPMENQPSIVSCKYVPVVVPLQLKGWIKAA